MPPRYNVASNSATQASRDDVNPPNGSHPIEEIKRRTHVARIYPNSASCLRLIRALMVEIHEDWIEATRYLNLELWEEHKKR